MEPQADVCFRSGQAGRYAGWTWWECSAAALRSVGRFPRRSEEATRRSGATLTGPSRLAGGFVEEGGPVMNGDWAAIETLFTPWARPDGPGCVLGIVQDGTLTYAAGYGLANLDHGIALTPASVFHVASVTKQFTAAAVLHLADAGQISLGDDIRVYLPELPDYDHPITIAQCLFHTSGLPDQWDLLQLAGWRADDVKTTGDILGLVSRQRTLNFVPGTEHVYCNTGYTLLALLVERAAGRSLRQYLEGLLFQPLGMARTHLHDDHTEVVPGRATAYASLAAGDFRISVPVFDTVGATGLFTTVEDLARWVGYLAAGRRTGERLVAQLLQPGHLAAGEALAYGFGMIHHRQGGLPVIEHSGRDAGYRAHLRWFPEHGQAVIILANLSTIDPAHLARRVAELLLAPRMTLPPPAPPADTTADAATLAELIGLYHSAKTGMVRRLQLENGRPVAGILGDLLALVPVGERRFRIANGLTEIAFEYDQSQAHWLWHERVPGSPATTFQAVPAATPRSTALTAYVGAYRSPELETQCSVVLHDGQLIWCQPKRDDQPLEPTFADGFSAGWWNLIFTRDRRGRVDGLILSTPRLRLVRYRKQPARRG